MSLSIVRRETNAVTREDRIRVVQHAVRVIERFVYRELSEATEPVAAERARTLQRLTVGLRRKLDTLEG